MDCCLIVYHPYRSLDAYTRELQIDTQIFEITWRIINDSLKTDVCLLYPPYEIAMACLVLACSYREKQHQIVKQYLIDQNNLDIEEIYEIIKYLLKYYELMLSYDDTETLNGKQLKDLLMKMPKPKLTANPQGPSRPSSQPNEQQMQQQMNNGGGGGTSNQQQNSGASNSNNM